MSMTLQAIWRRPAPVLGTVVLAVVGIYAAAFSAEPPVGALRGRLVADGSEQPLAGVSVTVRPKTPKSGTDSQYLETDATGSFEIRRLPSGTYDIEPLSEAHKNAPMQVVVQEGEAASAVLRLVPGDPYLNMNIHQHAVLPGDAAKVSLQGFRQGESLKVRLMSAGSDPSVLLDSGQRLRSLLTPVSTSSKGRFRGVRAPGVRVLREWTHEVKNQNGEGVFYDDTEIGKQKPGIYLVEAHGSGNNALGWFMVTDLGLVTKSAAGDVLAFAADLRSGAPRRGVKVTFFKGTAASKQVVTDARGVARVKLSGGAGDTVEALASTGTTVAVSRFFPWGYGGGEANRKYRVHTYTDRPVYRPGHLVRYKGVIRRLDGIGYALPSSGTDVQIEVTDDQGTSIREDTLRLNEHGSFHGELFVPSEARSGYYTITASYEGEDHTDNFAVASYRKPEWRVDVETPKKSYVRGENVPVTIRAQYYYGAPVVEGKVTYTVYRSPHWTWWSEEDDYVDEDEMGGGLYGDVVASGEAVTGEDGAARFEFPTNVTPEEGWTGDFDYAVEAEVSDLSNRYASGTGSVRVAAGEIVLDARAERSVAAPGEKIPVTVRTRDLAEKPAADTLVDIAVTLQKWAGRRMQETVLSSQQLRTDAKGEAKLEVDLPQAGLVFVKASTKDRRGNLIETSADIWVSTASGGDFDVSYPALAVVPDKKLYRIGDTAQVLVNTDRPGATAIVALEAERILEYRTVELKKKSTVVTFKIHAGYEPNVFVTACFIKNRQLATSQARLSVNAEAHRLKVTVESDRETYKPGDTAIFTVRTTRANGQPAPAEVSFGLVDESIYAIREDAKQGLWDAFYPRRQNEVLTEFSYPEIYLGDAAKDGSDTALRKNFQDTASWTPALRTDATGKATVQIKLPDNLTSWRATATAHTDRTEVGKATDNIQVQKELTLRLQTPRAITEGDSLTLSAVAHNYSGGPLDVRVSLQSAGLQISGGEKRVRLEPGKAERLTWDATAPTAGSATVTVTANGGAFSDGMQLTVPVQPFVREAIQYETGAVSGEEVATEEITLDPNAVTGEVELRIAPTLAGAILGSLDYLANYPHGCTEQTMSAFLPDVVIFQLLKSLGLEKPELQNHLPEMVQVGLLRLNKYQHDDGGWGWWENDDTEAWMTAYVMFGLQRSRAAGIEVNDRVWSNGLDRLKSLAKEEKQDPNEAMFVAYVLAETGQKAEAKALLKRFEKGVEKLQRRSLGYRALAFAALADPESLRRGEAAMDYLWSIVETNAGLVNWSEKRPDFAYGLPQDVETTAVILKAALALTPEDERLGGVVRWLLLKRNGNRWESTRDTAWILFALADYLNATGELSPDYEVTVALNGKEIHAEQVTPADALREEQVVRVPTKGLPANGKLEVRRKGTGTVYYSLKVTQGIKTPTFAPESAVAGLALERDYFRMETRRDADGRLSVLPEKKPATRFKVGDRILVRLTIRNERPLEHLMIESPLPAGCEVQDRGDLSREEWRSGGYWWSHQDVRDDRINLFIRNLPAAKPAEPHVIEYYLRPEMSGNLRALPAVLSDMYVPNVRASTGESKLEVAP